MDRGFDHYSVAENSHNQDFVHNKSPEHTNPNPYIEAGYKTGDVVMYEHAGGGQSIYDLELTEAGDGSVREGAWLITHGTNGKERASFMPSTKPDKCRIYSFTSKQHALQRYDELLSSNNVNTKEKLFDVLDAMARSTVTPEDVGSQTDVEPQGFWNHLKQLIDNVGSGKQDILKITRQHGLRAKVMSLFPEAFPKQADKKPQDDTDAPNIEKNKPPELQIVDPEKKAIFDRMQIGDELLLGVTAFRKISENSYMHATNHSDTGRTSTNRLSSREEIIRFINIPFLKPSEIKIIKFSGKDTPVVDESPKYLESLRNAFKEIEPSLYPDSWLSRKSTLEKIKTGNIKQGGFGDCYLLAAINSIKRTHPELYLQTLMRTIKKGDRPGEWKVSFRGITDGDGSDEAPIVVTENDLKAWKTGARADLADVILERAYASLKSRQKYGFQGMTHQADYRGRRAFEGGFGHRALDEIVGSEIAKKNIIADYRSEGASSLKQNGRAAVAQEFLLNEYAKNPERYILTANSPYTKDGKNRNDRMHEIINGVKMYYKHAYSIVGFKENQLYIENPHDTSKTFTMNIDQFLNFFSQLSYVEIRAKYQE